MSTRDEKVKMVSLTGYELNGWGIVIRFPEGTRDLLFFNRHTQAVPTQFAIQWAPGSLHPGIKRAVAWSYPLSLYVIPKSSMNRAIISLLQVPSLCAQGL